MAKTELKPCPFCGGEAKIIKDIRYPRPKRNPKKAYEVVCNNPRCIIFNADNNYYLKRKYAIEAWNKRYKED